MDICRSDKEKDKKSQEHHQKAFDMFNLMRKNKKFCDVTLTAGNTDIPAHKLVLSACSSYFYAMFTNFEESSQCKITLQNVDDEALQLIIEYVYTTEVHVTEDNVQVLLSAANLLQVDAIKDVCSDFLRTQLHPSNCLGIRDIADSHDCRNLLEHAETYIEDHFAEVVECDEFLMLTHDQLSKLISNDKLAMPSEEHIFECVITWIQKDAEKRVPYLINLMEHVRLPLIAQEYLNKRIDEEPILKNNPKFKKYIEEALLNHSVETDEKKSKSKPKTKPRRPFGRPKVLLVAGGRATIHFDSVPFRNVECFDFEEGRWCEVAEMLTPRSNFGLCSIKGKVYAVGGRDDQTNSFQTIEIYDIYSNVWSPCSAQMNEKRYAFGVTVLNDCIYAIGGWGSSSILNSAEMFNPKTQEWKLIAPMEIKRGNIGVGVIDGLLYAVGGYNGSEGYLRSVESYDPKTNQWTSVNDMATKRKGAGVAVLNGLLYAVGGCNKYNAQKSVEAYDPKTNSWISVADMHKCRSNVTVVAHDGRIYAVGGKDSTSSLTSVEVYDPITDSWSMLPSHMSIGRWLASSTIVDKRT